MMKKVIYSRWLKLAAILVFALIFCIMGRTMGNLWDLEESDAYRDARWALNEPIQDVINSLDAEEAAVHEEGFKKNLLYVLSRHKDTIDYYIELESPELKLSNNDDLELYKEKKYHYILEQHDGIRSEDSSSNIYAEGLDNARIYLSLKDTYAAKCDFKIEAWDRAHTLAFTSIMICLIAVLLIMAYLTAVCGRAVGEKAKFELKTDCWYQEITIGLMALILFVAGMIYALPMMMGTRYSDFAPYLTCTSSALCVLALLLFLSLIRNIKNKTFAGRSITCKLCKKLWWVCKSGAAELKGILGKKSGAILAVSLALYALIVCIFHFVGAVFGFLAACMIIGARARELDEIKNGAEQIRKGDFTHKIPECRSEDYKKLAQDINEIGEGFSAAVEEQIKSERLKTELITNVSHDLKTPLTSIINYAKLLEDMELSPEEARDYVKIISKKGESLKQLTSDLFDISKVQSGNETVELEKLDTAVLINQSLGELEDELTKSDLVLNVKLEEKLFIMADGKKMSRVMGNLLSNIIKYTMKNTRVFICSSFADGKAVMEFKNISAFPLDFDTEEITERFVRGDSSRTREGNGLGLAIAKSYTEACGGSLRVAADGDMFKVSIIFDSV